MPGYKVRQMIEEYDDKQQLEHKGRLSFEEFEKLCKELKANELGSTFKQVVSKKENLETLGGISEASSEGTTHSVRLEEQLAFSDWINTNLSHDPDLKHLLPIDAEGKTLYEKVKDGILLWYVSACLSSALTLISSTFMEFLAPRDFRERERERHVDWLELIANLFLLPTDGPFQNIYWMNFQTNGRNRKKKIWKIYIPICLTDERCRV